MFKEQSALEGNAQAQFQAAMGKYMVEAANNRDRPFSPNEYNVMPMNLEPDFESD